MRARAFATEHDRCAECERCQSNSDMNEAHRMLLPVLNQGCHSSRVDKPSGNMALFSAQAGDVTTIKYRRATHPLGLSRRFSHPAANESDSPSARRRSGEKGSL